MWLSGVALAAIVASANALDLTVAASGGNATSPLQYGLMFEDHQSVHIVQGLTYSSGYWGIGVEAQDYTGSFWVKGSYDGSFTASLKSDITKETLASVQIPSKASPSEWVQHNFTLTPASAAQNSNNSFILTFKKSGVTGGSLDFTLISLFPPTYKNRPNGLRKDIAEALKELNPKFLRFPGGNNLEGDDPPYLWYWNETIGPLKDRPGRPGTWGYQNTDGLGLIEYLHWCQDLEFNFEDTWLLGRP
ncbi:putative vacuolar segregation protein [Aureobasidium pullulans]|nr:putative vacuolar segregation protein [Aureobasidium pullulans]